MKKIIAILLLAACAFGAGTLFQKQIGVGTVLVRLGLKQDSQAAEILAPRLAAMEALAIPDRRIVFTGDSLIAVQEWSEVFPSAGIINRGVAGAKIQDLTGRYDFARAKAVFCLVGINDILSGANLAEFKTRYQKYVDSIPKGVAFYAISIPAVLRYGDRSVDVSLIEQCNQYIRQATLQRAGTYIDIFGLSQVDNSGFHVADGLHFSREAYRKISAVLQPFVTKAEL